MTKNYAPAKDRLEATALELKWLESDRKITMLRKVFVAGAIVLAVLVATGLVGLVSKISSIVLGK